MMQKIVTHGIARVILYLLLALSPVLSAQPSPTLVASSSLLEDILGKLTVGEDDIHMLVPGATCPGHYDLRPSDVQQLSSCAGVFLHDWQMNMSNFASVLKAAKIPPEKIQVIKVDGNWMVPPTQIRAIGVIAQALSKQRPAKAGVYAQRAAQYQVAVAQAEKKTMTLFQNAQVHEINVICNERQSGFVQWAGFKVVQTFANSNEISVAQLERLIQLAQKEQATLIVDNLQSGDSRMSETLARETGTLRVVLSNFPGGFKKTNTWEKNLMNNTRLLLNAAAQWRNQHE